MPAVSCLCLPALKGPAPRPGMLRLCPGLPLDAMPDAATLEIEWPFPPSQAQSLLAEMASLDNSGLENFLNSAQAFTALQTGLAEHRELSALKDFAAGRVGGRVGDDESLEKIMLEQAQKTLLWQWRLEELQAEIASLGEKFAKFSGSLAMSLDDPLEESLAPLPELEITPPKISWKMTIANALLFADPEMPIFAEGEMTKELAEMLEFRPACEILAGECFEGLSAAKASACGVLKNNVSKFPRRLRERLETKRIWLIEESV